jgi:hypothetical protein
MRGLLTLTILSAITLSLVDVTIGHSDPTGRSGEEQRSVATLNLYGPGGPLGPMRECADMG